MKQVSMPDDLHAQLKARAESELISVPTALRQAVTLYLGGTRGAQYTETELKDARDKVHTMIKAVVAGRAMQLRVSTVEVRSQVLEWLASEIGTAPETFQTNALTMEQCDAALVTLQCVVAAGTKNTMG